MKTFKTFIYEMEIDELDKKTLDNYTQKAIDSHGHANFASRVAKKIR